MNSKQFMIVVVITFIVGMVWLVSDIIFNTKASIPISEKLQSSLEPINPTFNSRILEVIGSETMSTSEVAVNEPTVLQAPVDELVIEPAESPTASAVPSPVSSSIPAQSATPNPNLTPLITVPAATTSANPLLPTP